MKIVHIQVSMPPAGNACFRLHQAMLKAGIESSVLTLTPTIKRNNVVSLSGKYNSFFKRCVDGLFFRYVYSGYRGDLLYSYLPKYGRNIIHSHPLVKNSDVIYFHWIAGGSLAIDEIDKIASTGKPVIMFMHDMWNFTGGCHCSFDCDQYKTGCTNCKMFGAHSQIPYRQLTEKRDIFQKHQNIIFVSPSNWMADCARQSYALSRNRVICINNLIDDTVFKQFDKKLSRDILNLPLEKTIITFGCQAGTNNKIKGWNYLQKALCQLKNDNIHIVIYGSDSNPDTIKQVPYPITFLGPIFDETKLALICNATDVFVSPSLSESFGMTFLENILCGTPVVGFDNTAVGEIVIKGVTGYLAQNKDVEDLAYGIQALIDKSLSPITSYKTKNVLDSHIELITSIL